MYKPWLVWSSEDEILEEFETEQEAVDCANETLQRWREQAQSEGEWDDAGVEAISVFRLAHHVVVSKEDKDGCDYELRKAP